MTDYMESEQTTLVTVKLIEAVGALTDVELDCLAQMLDLSTSQRLCMYYAATVSWQQDAIYGHARTMLSREPAIRKRFAEAIKDCGLEAMNFVATVASRLITINCWITDEDPDFTWFAEFGIPDETLQEWDLDRDCMPWKNNERATMSILNKILPELFLD